MKTKRLSKILAMALCIAMIAGAVPNSVFAYSEEFKSETHDVFKHTESTIAPGVEQYINYAYAKDGKQMVYYVATADISRDDVMVQSAYKDAQCTNFGMEKLTNQMAAATAKYSDPDNEEFISEYYMAVAGTNGDFYNMQTGRPSGAFVMNGIMSSNKANNRPWFAVFADGTALCGANNADWDAAVAAHGAAWQAVGGSQLLVKDGKDVTASASGSYNTDRHSRTMVGVTADGKVVMAVLDGRQEPFSCGGTMHELAQIMLEAECVMAINLDGGGSTTFAARQEGADQVTIVNRPSDGSERSISSGLIIASLAAPSDTFDHATLTAADEYVTPGTSTQIKAVGVSPAGTAAEIPEGVEYVATNGTIDENGMFVAADAAGDAVVSMRYNGETVGTVTVHVVIPDQIAFSSSTITVPYGKTAQLEIAATYGLNAVTTKAEDFLFELGTPEAGTLEGLFFTAADEEAGIQTSTITVTFVGDTSKVSTATLTMGKGSAVLWDFEDQDISDWTRYSKSAYNYIWTPGTVSLATKEDGQVHSGNYALRFNCDFSVSTEAGYMSGLLGLKNEEVIDLKGATSFGMWIYFPYEAKSLNGRIYMRQVTARDENGDILTYVTGNNDTDATLDGTGNWNVGFVTSFQESGWHYISFDLTRYGELGGCIPPNATILDIYINDRDNTAYNYNHLDYKSLNQNVVMYIDDVTVDYSSVVDDREAPIFSSVLLGDKGSHSNDALVLQNGYVSDMSELSLSARVAENTRKSNATGIDASTAKAYVDGKEVACRYENGLMVIDDIDFTNGSHTIKFTICDKQGNYASAIRTFSVEAADNNGSTIKLRAHDAALDKILLGSIYYVDLVATDVETVEKVVADLDLNNISIWQLDHMDVAKGFEATYSIIDTEDNIARVTVTRNGSSDATGELALVSMPIRTWELPAVAADYGHKGVVWMYPDYKKGSETWPIDICVTVKSGEVTFVDGTADTFAGENVQVDTESYVWDNATKPAEYATWNGGHDHRPETKQYYAAGTTNHVDAAALTDKAATCTENGYTGRTFCEVCNSVVDWGTTIPATGHTYELVEGILQCTACGELFTGEWTDGKAYADGVVISDGWVNDSYYVDGVKRTGIHRIEGYYYDFGEDGVCVNRTKYTGFYKQEDGWYYIAIGEIAKGWQYIDGGYYYFDPDTGLAYYGKKYYIYQQSYQFDEKGQVLHGLWVERSGGTFYYYGPSYYMRTWAEIDGETYYFDNDGHRKEGISWFYTGQSNNPPTWYEFSEDGKLIRIFDNTGLFEFDGKLYYLNNGVNQHGLFEVDGEMYYFRSSDYTAVSGRYWVNTTNGLDVTPGYYIFDENTHAMVREKTKNGLIVEEDGVHYYIDGVQTYAGLVEVDGEYYYINSTLKAVTGKYWVEKTNDLLAKGYYEFDAEGKMIREKAKEGLVVEADGTHYYVNGVPTYAGLVEVDGEYYYINSTLRAVTGKYWVEKTNDLLAKGYYEFDAEGKMIREKAKEGLVVEADGTHYYVNGVPTYAGLVEVDGEYYYINSTLKAVTGKYWVEKTNDLLAKGFYEFDAEGKMIREKAKEGLVVETDGTHYYVNGVPAYAGLVKVDGEYYYINSTLKAVTGRYWVEKNNGLLAKGYYEFDADGKMIIR